ncbi:transcriptional regulator, TetR family [Virgibacillus subterraneus]|uniref:Transcriptional regulator, TetR family n=2 Tax=Virgibacillus TaxID=84406 RepID=A0A1H1F3X4_9BACI|nr:MULTISPECIES: TetR/AcrR family transcriptional regulator [Virgibacillus]SDQ95637.1 transcriptional regulator, TetR family [Virgibacillus salinus]SEQ96881.1 transcriptional regulator, TetR family [Virgibacillus subterraneus]
MRDKTEQILKAAGTVFIKKGLQATTQEIANEANVAEVTLYRKFSTKQNLFITVIKNVLEKQFGSHVMELAKKNDTEAFLTSVIENRLEVLSKNTDLVKMLISESLRGNLPEEINLPTIIFTSLKKGLDHHFEGENVDTDFCTRQLGGVFLSYVALPNDGDFYKLTEEKKHTIAKKHAQSILASI